MSVHQPPTAGAVSSTHVGPARPRTARRRLFTSADVAASAWSTTTSSGETTPPGQASPAGSGWRARNPVCASARRRAGGTARRPGGSRPSRRPVDDLHPEPRLLVGCLAPVQEQVQLFAAIERDHPAVGPQVVQWSGGWFGRQVGRDERVTSGRRREPVGQPGGVLGVAPCADVHAHIPAPLAALLGGCRDHGRAVGERRLPRPRPARRPPAAPLLAGSWT
jgi:hypothetical protein